MSLSSFYSMAVTNSKLDKNKDYFLTTKIINYSPTDMNPRLPLYDQQQSDFNTLSDISSLLFCKNRGKIRPQGHYNLVNLVPC